MDRRIFLKSLAAPLLVRLDRDRADPAPAPQFFTTFHRPAPASGTVLCFSPAESGFELSWAGHPLARPVETVPLEAFEEDKPWFKHVFRLKSGSGEPGGYQLLFSGEPVGPERRLQPLPPFGDPLRVVVFGDSGHASETQDALCRLMRAEDPHLVLHTGDLAYPVATLDCLRRNYIRPYADWMATVPFYPCLGNHDFGHDGAPHALALHDLPISPDAPRGCYSFAACGVRFIAADTNELSDLSSLDRVLSWLETTLSSSQELFRIAFLHHTPFPNLRHLADWTSYRVRERVMPLLARHRVPLVLAGHEHLYQRTSAALDPVVVTTGGGGGGLYEYSSLAPNEVGASVHHFVVLEFQGDSLKVSAKDIEGNVIDQFHLKPLPAAAD